NVCVYVSFYGQLEKYVDDAIRKHDFQALEQFLETDFSDGICHKCSKQFLNKFDRLICQGLEREEVENVSTLLNILQKHGKNINILDVKELRNIVNNHFSNLLIQIFISLYMVNWFEKAKEILKYKVNEKNDSFTTFFENFFDVLMIIHDTSSEGKIQILENFVLRTCALTAEKRINVYIQQEAVRKLNIMLDSMPRDTRKKIISTKEMLAIMNDMGKRILDAGDYDLQVAITEALCRMTSEKQRGELASQWFSMEFVTDAFKGIKDFEFETDCRKFLNKVNGMLGDKRRVFTYPCLSANLDKHELQIPADENLEEFWIDFNIGSKSVSFYIAADDEGQQWETVCIPEKDVKTYIIEEQDKKKLLIIHLNNPTSVGIQEGEKIILHFDSALEIADIAKKVYRAVKCQGFPKKKTMSVAKTTVHVIFDESGSQVLVPESQITQLKENNCKLLKENGSNSLQNLYPQTQKNMNDKANTIDIQTVQSKITPAKRKMSEASMVVPSAGRLSMQSLLPFMNTYEVIDIVPESQLVEKSDKPLLPGLLENSLAEIKTQRRHMCWVPETIITHCNRQSISSLGNTFPEAINLSDGAAKQRAFSSIFEMTSSELRNKHHCNGDNVELQHNENKTPAKNHNINSADSWNTFKHMDKEISKSSRRKNISSKSEISLNAMKMNDTSLENSRHLKLVIETNENASFDVSSSGKKTANKKTDQVKC
ncbi:Synaptonemal complex protein 2, partial [Varanus komodoensis]